MRESGKISAEHQESNTNGSSEQSKKPRRQKRSREEILLDKCRKAEMKVIRQAEKMKRASEKELKKQQRLDSKKNEPTEEELVRRYANRTIKNQMYHGRIDKNKFEGLDHTHSVSKELWMDTDFFFSVVFQSKEQKYEFFTQLQELLSKSRRTHGLEIDEKERMQIINGLEFAKAIGIELKPETTRAYPTGNLDLMPLVLDNESIDAPQGE